MQEGADEDVAHASPVTGKSPKREASIQIVADASEKPPARQPAQVEPAPEADADAAAAPPKAEEPAAPEEPEDKRTCVVLPREQAWTRVLAYEVAFACLLAKTRSRTTTKLAFQLCMSACTTPAADGLSLVDSPVHRPLLHVVRLSGADRRSYLLQRVSPQVCIKAVTVTEADRSTTPCRRRACKCASKRSPRARRRRSSSCRIAAPR